MAKTEHKTDPAPTQDVLNSLLRYEPESGKLYWKERPHSMFPNVRASKVWNSRYAGTEAFTSYDAYGYRQGNIYNRRNKAHRVIMKMVHGEFEGDVDHINGVRDDNRLENLRIVSRMDNLRNSTIRADNTSGCVGIDFRNATGKWRARIGSDHVGVFPSYEEAVAARKLAERSLGYHINHGKPRKD